MRHIIVNPAAGSGSAAQKADEISRLLTRMGAEFLLYETRHAGHAREIAEKITQNAPSRKNADVIFCVGGDGTAQEIASALPRTGVALGLLPAGSGNDMARSLKYCYKKNHIKLAERYLKGDTQKIDLIRVNTPNRDFCCANAASLGLDAEIVVNAERFKKRFGSAAYVVSTMDMIPRYKPIEYTVTFDGGCALKERLTLIAVCNGGIYGGGFKVAPLAKNNDGLATVCKISDMSLRRMFMFFPFMLLGVHGVLKSVNFFELEKITVAFDGAVNLNIDGNIYEINGFAAFETLKDALTLCI